MNSRAQFRAQRGWCAAPRGGADGFPRAVPRVARLFEHGNHLLPVPVGGAFAYQSTLGNVANVVS